MNSYLAPPVPKSLDGLWVPPRAFVRVPDEPSKGLAGGRICM